MKLSFAEETYCNYKKCVYGFINLDVIDKSIVNYPILVLKSYNGTNISMNVLLKQVYPEGSIIKCYYDTNTIIIKLKEYGLLFYIGLVSMILGTIIAIPLIVYEMVLYFL